MCDIDGFMQERRNSSVFVMELHLSCANPSDVVIVLCYEEVS